ncbi:hypothetical protein EO217_00900 (plasmid) [Enterococcus faecium]|nr:hypothetical protein EO217_00900 [Enterococcus faecium]
MQNSYLFLQSNKRAKEKFLSSVFWRYTILATGKLANIFYNWVTETILGACPFFPKGARSRSCVFIFLEIQKLISFRHSVLTLPRNCFLFYF